MSETTELERIRQVLRLVHREVEKWDANQELALEYLRSIKDAVDRYPGTREAAEYELALGEVFTAAHSPAAESCLRKAGESIARLSDPAPDLEVRFYDRKGYFCERVLRNRIAALKHLERAKAAAMRLGVGEIIAHQQLRLIRLDLNINCNSEGVNFMTLRKVARKHGFTDEERLAAWYQHLGKRERYQISANYARGIIQKRTEQYFLDLLSSVRVHP
jgi:hypothetical protein